MSTTRDWHPYVATLCRDAWELSPDATAAVMRGIEELIASDRVTDSAVAGVLRGAGVSALAADLTAFSVRVVVKA